LLAEVEDGRIVRGETRIVDSRSRIKRLWLSRADCRPLPETLEAIKEADIITIGPGSLYTSLIPNLLVHGIVEAINNSAALKVYICNIMTQPGETEGFSIEDHLRVLFEYSPELQFDYAIANSTLVTKASREKYLADGAVQVKFKAEPPPGTPAEQRIKIDIDGYSKHTIRVIREELLNETGLVRHDPQKLAKLLLKIQRAERALALSIVNTQ
jgi:uncharacterized cofD-like protein